MRICSTYLMYTPIWRLVFELGAGTSSIALGHASRLPLPPPYLAEFPSSPATHHLYARWCTIYLVPPFTV